MSAEVITKVYVRDVEDHADVVSYGPKSIEEKKLVKTELWDNSNESWRVNIFAISDVSYKRIDNHGELWLDGLRIGYFKLRP